MDPNEWAKSLQRMLLSSNPAWSRMRLHKDAGWVLHGTLSAVLAAVGDEKIEFVHVIASSRDDVGYVVVAYTADLVAVVKRFGPGVKDVIVRVQSRADLTAIDILQYDLRTAVGHGDEEPLLVALKYKGGIGNDIGLEDRDGSVLKFMPSLRRDLARL